MKERHVCLMKVYIYRHFVINQFALYCINQFNVRQKPGRLKIAVYYKFRDELRTR